MRLHVTDMSRVGVRVMPVCPVCKGEVWDGTKVCYHCRGYDFVKGNATLTDEESRQVWRSLEVGMSKESVTQLLGTPLRVDVVDRRTRLVFTTTYSTEGFVFLDPNGLVDGWTEPTWGKRGVVKRFQLWIREH